MADYESIYRKILQHSWSNGIEEYRFRFRALAYGLGTNQDITNTERGERLKVLCELYDGIEAHHRKARQPESCEGCPFIVQDEDTGREICGLGGKMGECNHGKT